MKSYVSQFNAEIPNQLYRHFSEEAHLEEFLSGNFRLGYYKSYSNLPNSDIRKNATEGMFKGLLIRPSGKTSSMIYGATWPMYILCFFSPSTDAKTKKEHGKYAVRINNPKELHKRIANHLSASIRSSFVGNMAYIKDLYIDAEDFKPPIDFHVYCDNMIHSNKKEVRFTYCFDLYHLLPKHKQEPAAFQLPLPPYVEILGLKVDDLCEKIDIEEFGQ